MLNITEEQHVTPCLFLWRTSATLKKKKKNHILKAYGKEAGLWDIHKSKVNK